MKKQTWFLLPTVGLLFLLLGLPINSRADTLLEQYAGPLGSEGLAAGWRVAMPNFGASLAARPMVGFGGAVDGMAGGVGTRFDSGMYAGRSLFGDGWGLNYSVWTGTNYVFPYGDDNNTPVSTPEPATVLLLATGLIGLFVFRRFAGGDM